MPDQKYKEIPEIQQNEGIFGQKTFAIKNKNYMWTLKIIDNKLWGRYTQNEGGTWFEWQELFSDYNGFFSFTISEENKLHIICRNSKEHIQYCCWQGNKITVDLLDHRWINQEKVIQQKIIVDSRGLINLFMFTENQQGKSWRIKYCFKSNEQWSLPEEIDSGRGPNLNQGEVALGPGETIYLIYQIFHKGTYQLVYRKKQSFLTQWSEKIPITASIGINLYPCLVIDKKGTIHLTWVRSENMNLRVMYRRKAKTAGGWIVEGWQKELYLSEPETYCYSPAIRNLENKVEVYWQQKDGIYKCISDNEGRNFTEPNLLNEYQDLSNFNQILLDLNKQEGFSFTAFDTVNTVFRLLVGDFQSYLQVNNIQSMNINENKESKKNNENNTNITNLQLNETWQEFQKYLEKLNGNFRRLLFEIEDLKMIDFLKETVEEQAQIIEKLKREIEKKEYEIEQHQEKEQTLLKTIEKLKESMHRKKINNLYHSNQVAIGNNIKNLEEENKRLKKGLLTLQNLHNELKQRLTQKEALISQLEKMGKK